MNNIIRAYFLLLFFFIPIVSFTEEIEVCNENVIMAYFNGVATTSEQAQINLDWLEHEHKKNKTDNSVEFEYELLYNTKQNLFLDILETLKQRFKEKKEAKNKSLNAIDGHYELFFESTNDNNIYSSEIIEVLPELEEAIDNFRKEAKEIIDKNLKKETETIIESDYRKHREKIDEWIKKDFKLLFLAHSQGNLFANESYRYARGNLGYYIKNKVQLVHIAPASVNLNGRHVLADIDLVIKSLYLTFSGDVQKVTDSVPIFSRTFPFLRKSGLNKKRDIIFGHGLLEVYLNPYLDISKNIWKEINNSIFELRDKLIFGIGEDKCENIIYPYECNSVNSRIYLEMKNSNGITISDPYSDNISLYCKKENLEDSYKVYFHIKENEFQTLRTVSIISDKEKLESKTVLIPIGVWWNNPLEIELFNLTIYKNKEGKFILSY